MITKDEMVEAILDFPTTQLSETPSSGLSSSSLIEQRIAEAEAGNVVSHEEARRRFAAWLVCPDLDEI